MAEGRASIAKHPIHPMLVVFPIGLWVCGPGVRHRGDRHGNPLWRTLAFWNIIGGIVGALLAAVPGFLDYPAGRAGSGASPPGTWSSTWPRSRCSRSTPSSGSASKRVVLAAGAVRCRRRGRVRFGLAGRRAGLRRALRRRRAEGRVGRTGLAAWPRDQGAGRPSRTRPACSRNMSNPRGASLQRQPVRDDEARIDLALLDPLEQRLHVALHVALAGLDRQRAVHHRAHRELVDEAAVDADHRDRPAVAAGHDRLRAARTAGRSPASSPASRGRRRRAGPGTCASMPTASMHASGPRPPVISLSAS